MLFNKFKEKIRTIFKDGKFNQYSSQKKIVKVEAHKKILVIVKSRLLFIIIIFSLCFAMLGVRLSKLAFFGAEVAEYNKNLQLSDLQYERGEIIDRNGTLLAVNLATGSLYANPKIIIDPKEAAMALLKVIPGLEYNDLLEKLTSNKSFVWVKRNLTPREQQLINNLGIPGLYFKNEEKRVYPHGRLLSHVMGYVGVDGHGLAGIEKKFDQYLLSEEAQDNPLKLSIDIRVQEIIYRTLDDAVKEFRAAGATGLVMDVNTGEVIGMVSLPDFNSNNVGASAVANRFNRSTLGIYEMGSIFKAFTMAMAMDNNNTKLSDVFDATNPIKIGGFTINDAHPKAKPLTLAEVFMYSSNIGTVKIALSCGEKIQQAFLKKFGMFEQSPLEVPEKGRPMYPRSWRKINLMTISYGHGIAVSPVHVASGISALINGGILYPATILKREDTEDEQGKRVIKKTTSDNMRKLFRLVVEQGTGSKAEVKGYMVGGKTGTAEKLSGHNYSESAKLSSFVGAFPMNDPHYVVFVTLDEPKGTKETGGFATGGMVAAPSAAKIIAAIGPLLGIRPVNIESSRITNIIMNKDQNAAVDDTDR